MTPEEMRKAITEITLGKTFKESSVPKTTKNKIEWNRLVKEVDSIKKQGYMVDGGQEWP